MSTPESTEKSEEKPEKKRVFRPMHGIRLEPEPGMCPGCDAKAPLWHPPLSDRGYRLRFQQIKEVKNLETNVEAHKEFMRQNGGFIARCACGVSFFVPAEVVEIGEEV